MIFSMKKQFAVAVLLLTLVVACAWQNVELPDVSQTRWSQNVGEIYGAASVGQTFVADAAGLNRIDLRLSTYVRQNTGPLIFHLRESPAAATELVTITVDAATVQDNVYRPFYFPPLADSRGKSYYFFLEAPQAVPGNALTTWFSPDDNHPQGTMLRDGQSVAGDLTFYAYYDYSTASLLADIGQALSYHLSVILLAVLLFLLPGYALAVVFLPRQRWGLGERLLAAPVLSVVFYPLVLYLGWLTGLRLDAWRAGLILAACGAVAVWGLWQEGRAVGWRRLPAVLLAHTDTYALALLAVLAVALTARFLVIRGVSYPAWADSYQHSVIVQLMVERGGVPDSWRPYALLDVFTYHFGWHAVVAFFHWLTGVAVPQSVLLVGQVLNALSLLPIYLFLARATGSKAAGVWGAVVVGYLAVMPAYYVNWGRYTQLSGQFVLPLALLLTMEAAKAPRFAWRPSTLAALAVASLALSHYRVLLFYVLFVLAYLLVQTLRRLDNVRFPRHCEEHPFASPERSEGAAKGCDEAISLVAQQRDCFAALAMTNVTLSRRVCQPSPRPSPGRGGEGGEVARLWWQLAVVGLLALLIFSPWLAQLVGLSVTRYQQAGAPEVDPQYNFISWEFLTTFGFSVPLMILAVGGALWGLARRQWAIVVTALWVPLLFLLANPYLLHLPGTGLVNNGMVTVGLYVPGAILAGYFLGSLSEAVLAWLVRRGAIGRRALSPTYTAAEGGRRAESPTYAAAEAGRRAESQTYAATEDGRRALSPTYAAWGRAALAGVMLAVALVGARGQLGIRTPDRFYVLPADEAAMPWIRQHTPPTARFLINTEFWLANAAIGTDAGYWLPLLAGRETTMPPMYASDAEPEYIAQVNALARAAEVAPTAPDTLAMMRAAGVTHVYIGQRGGSLRPEVLAADPHFRPIYHQGPVWVLAVDYDAR